LVANEDTTIKIFDMTTGEKTNELKGHEDAVLDLVWDNSKEGLLISASSDCSFKLWQ
jgi:WD40 repeat protein